MKAEEEEQPPARPDRRRKKRISELCDGEAERVAQYFPSGRTSITLSPPMLDMTKPFLERFNLQQCIHRAGRTAVFAAEDSVQGCQVALKVIRLGKNDDSVAERVEQGLAVLRAASDSCHIVCVSDLFLVPNEQNPELLALVMEYGNGGSFRRWLREHRDDADYRRTEGLFLFRRIVEDIGVLHKIGAIHGDIKPENFVFVNDELKVTDLEDSIIEPKESRDADAPKQETEQVVARGTSHYMSPEQFSSGVASCMSNRSDIYSLGVILYEIFSESCRPPFIGSHARLEELHRLGCMPDWSGIGPSVRPIIECCLRRDPGARYQSVGDLLHDIESVERDVTVSGTRLPQPHKGGEVVGLWNEAKCLVVERCHVEAARLCLDVLNLDPFHLEAQRLYEELQVVAERERTLYAGIERDMDERPLDDVVRRFTLVQREHPNSHLRERIAVELEVRIASVAEGLVRAMEAWKSGHVELALGFLKEALAADPKSALLNWTVNQCEARIRHRKQLGDGVDAARVLGEWPSATVLAEGLNREMFGA